MQRTQRKDKQSSYLCVLAVAKLALAASKKYARALRCCVASDGNQVSVQPRSFPKLPMLHYFARTISILLLMLCHHNWLYLGDIIVKSHPFSRSGLL